LTALVSTFGELPAVSYLRSTIAAYAAVNAVHILCLGVLLGSILPLDLSILKAPGFGWAGQATIPLRRMALCAFTGAVLSGAALFAVRPADYLGNITFLAKICAILVAGINALIFYHVQRTGVRRVLAALSIAIWLFVLGAGRWIGFT
jgi:hypothetical protein